MADITEQLQINIKLNEAIRERNALMEKQRSLIIDQIAVSRELCNAMQCADPGDMEKNVLKTKEALEGLFKASEKAKELPSVMGKTQKAFAGAAAGAAASMAVWKGTAKVFGSVSSKAGALIKGLFSIVGALGRVAKSIISIPFKLMEGLIEMSNKFGRFTELSHALERVREKFGDLEKGTGRILKNSLRPMRQQMNQLAAAGHGFAATFGRGPAGMAKALEFNAELMEALNGGTEKLRNEIGENIGAMAIYRKGMGLTAQQQATLVALADAQGKNIVTVQHEYAKFSLEMGKRFGLDSKLIGKAMADMTDDVGNFGTLSTKQLAQVATYTQRLGIETKALQGVIKKYDDFEDAAKSAAMLNQSFGMQVDVLKMLKDEDPASRLSQLQKSFQATGKSYESLSRVERRRLAELAGLDDKSAALAFSQGGLSKSYEEVQAAGEETEVGFKDINQTLKELSKNMAKVLEEPDDFKSFFGAFTRGFEKGVIMSGPFMKIMRNLRQSLTIVERAGKQVGRAFVEMFPGVKQVLTGLSDFFNPGTTRQRMSKVISSFKEFFQMLQGGPAKAREAVRKLWDDLSGNFTSFFGSKSGTTSQIMEGIKTFASVLGNVALNFGIKVVENVSKGFRVVADLFKNMKEGDTFNVAIEKAIGTSFPDVSGFFSNAFGSAASDLGNVVMTQLWPALSDAMLLMFDYLYTEVLSPFWTNTLSPWLSSLWSDYVAPFFSSLGSMIIDAWLGAVKDYWNEGSVGMAALIFLAPIAYIFGPMLMGILGPLLSGVVTLITAKLAAIAGVTATGGGLLASLAPLAGAIVAGAAGIALAILKIGGAIAIVGVGFAAAIWGISKALGVFAESLGELAKIDGENLLKVGAGMMAVAAGMGAMGAATAASAIGGVVGGVVNTIGELGSGVKGFFTGGETKKTGIAGIVEDLKAFTSSEIEPDKIQKNADAIKIFTGAMASFTLFNATTAREAMVNAGIVLEDNPFLSMQNEIKAFSALDLDPERIKKVADSIAVFSEALAKLSVVQVPDNTSFWDGLGNGSPNLKTINSIGAQINAFKRITIDDADKDELIKKFEFIKVFAEAMAGFADSMNKIATMRIPHISKRLVEDSLGNLVEGSSLQNLKPHVEKLKELANSLDGFEQKAERIRVFIEVMNSLSKMEMPDIDDGKGLFSDDDDPAPKSSIVHLERHIDAIKTLHDKIPPNMKAMFDDKIMPFTESMNRLANVKIAEFEGIASPADSKIHHLKHHITAFQELEFNNAKITANAQSITEFAKIMETLKGIDEISDMKFDSEKLESIRIQTRILVDNLNEVFKSTQAELTRLGIDESFKTNLFENSILSNMQGIIQLKTDVKKLSESGPSPRTIKANMTNFVASLVEIQKQVGEVGLKASQIVTTLGAGAGAEGLKGIGTIVSDLNTAASSLKEFQNPKNRVDDTEIGKSMLAMDSGLKAMSTGLDAMKGTIRSISRKFGSQDSANPAGPGGWMEGLVGLPGSPSMAAEQKFDVSAGLDPINEIIDSVKTTMSNMKGVQEAGLDSTKVGTQIGQLTSSLGAIKDRFKTLAATLGDRTQMDPLKQNVTTAVTFFETLNEELGKLRGKSEELINNIRLATQINNQMKAIQSMETLNTVDITKKIDGMKTAAGAFSTGIQNMMTGDGAVKITIDQKNLLQDLSNATTNYLSAVESLKRISAARINVGDLTAKMESIESLFSMVLNVSDDLYNIESTIMTLTGVPIDEEASNRYINSIALLLSNVRFVMDNFSTHLPERVIARAEQTVEAVKRMDANFREIAATPVVATAIAIGESFKGGGTVTFRHENININLAVNVEMSAEQIARGIIKTTVKGTEGKANQEVRVATDPQKYDFDI